MEEIVLSLAGIVLGFFFGQASNLISERRAQDRRRQLSRTLLTLEMDSNLELLSDYWGNVTLMTEDKNEIEVQAERHARRALEIPLPIFATLAWSSQLSHLPQVLDENELTASWRLYNDLSKIRTLHDRLARVQSSESSSSEKRFPRSSHAMKEHQGVTEATFLTESAALIFDLREIANSLLKRGNPLA